MALVALTGASGFVGGHVLDGLVAAGCRVRALARRPDPSLAARPGVEPVLGSLGDAAGIEVLVRGADAVVHVAGAIHAPDRAAFLAANAAGAARVAEAAARAGCPLLVHVSSLAARAPGLSAYAESKALGEQEALRRGDRLRVAVVRPPAVYGPGDRATLPLLRGLARGWLAAPAAPRHARFSLLHARDLAALVVRLIDAHLASGTVVEPDDGTDGGYGWADLARLASDALGRKVRLVRVPRPALELLARLAERRAASVGTPPPVSRAKVAELFHPDWVCRRGTLAGLDGWRPEVGFARGLPATLCWYRQAGWL